MIMIDRHRNGPTSSQSIGFKHRYPLIRVGRLQTSQFPSYSRHFNKQSGSWAARRILLLPGFYHPLTGQTDAFSQHLTYGGIARNKHVTVENRNVPRQDEITLALTASHGSSQRTLNFQTPLRLRHKQKLKRQRRSCK
jgi:hypothetical protein